MTKALELRHVSKTYGSGAHEVHALSNVDLAVERGELVAVMGPSGSGKSTLLTIAGSLEQPTSGQVVVDSVDLANVSRSEQARMRRRSIGYVFQDFNLLPGLTALENVTLPLELDGAPAKPQKRAPDTRSRNCKSRSTPAAIRTSSPAVSVNASQSPGRSSANATCSSPTNPRERSTPSTAKR